MTAIENKLESASDQTSYEIAIKKRTLVLQDLINSEKMYVRNLGQLVYGYMAVIEDPKEFNYENPPIPEELMVNSTQYTLLYNRMKEIYEWHKAEFLPAIEECLHQPQELQTVFEKLNSVIHLYIIYYQKSELSMYLVLKHEEFFEELKYFLLALFPDIQPISSILTKPLQKIRQYNLLLEEILKYTEQAMLCDQTKSIQNAVDVMCKLTRQIDEYIILGRIYDFDGNVNDQGKLLLHGPMSCTDKLYDVSCKPKKMKFNDRYVFLFENMIMFTKVNNKCKSFGPYYCYTDHVSVNKMELDEHLSDIGSFTIKSTDSNNWTPINFVCRPDCFTMRFKWLKEVKILYKKNCELIEALQNPLRFKK